MPKRLSHDDVVGRVKLVKIHLDCARAHLEVLDQRIQDQHKEPPGVDRTRVHSALQQLNAVALRGIHPYCVHVSGDGVDELCGYTR